MNKPTVAVVYGSRSTEHDVSIVTAISNVIKPLELTNQYEVVPIYIDKKGRWFSDPKLKNIQIFTSGNIDELLTKLHPIAIEFNSGLTIVKPGLRQKRIKVDIVFPALHGTHGEDGEVMAVCELANIAYVGCDPRSSEVAMDKVIAKQIIINNDISTPEFVYASKPDFESNSKLWLDRITSSLTFPLFVKPAHLGSSIGITKVQNPKELKNAIEVALHYDDKFIVEAAVPNLIEVTLPIMGNEEPIPALLEQPLVQVEDFFDFDSKYMQGGKKGKGGAKSGSQGYSKLPADLPKELYKKAEQTGIACYKALGCSGISRIDMLINNKTETVYFNEANPLPGSLYAHNWNKAGISNVELVKKMIEFALQRYQTRNDLSAVFDTNYLQQF